MLSLLHSTHLIHPQKRQFMQNICSFSQHIPRTIHHISRQSYRFMRRIPIFLCNRVAYEGIN